jgi:hypothetical protein
MAQPTCVDLHATAIREKERKMRMALCTILIAAGLVGCANEPVDRESKLLTMAAGEAQQIPDSTQRLTRQLNFASQQMQRGRSEESKQSLAFAAQTLRDAKPGDLKPQIRIAGWVSISELSRQGNDLATAKAACDQAVKVLDSLDPVADRPQYVIGVASEVQALQGKPAAAKLLESSADWIKQLNKADKRREALTDVCRQIFNDDDYDGGLMVLRSDNDAAWRSDTLALIARSFHPAPTNQIGFIAHVPSFIDPSELTPGDSYKPSFSKPVDYQSVFSQSKSQN